MKLSIMNYQTSVQYIMANPSLKVVLATNVNNMPYFGFLSLFFTMFFGSTMCASLMVLMIGICGFTITQHGKGSDQIMFGKQVMKAIIISQRNQAYPQMLNQRPQQKHREENLKNQFEKEEVDHPRGLSMQRPVLTSSRKKIQEIIIFTSV